MAPRKKSSALPQYDMCRPQRDRVVTVFEGPTRTKTDQARDANVNHIVQKYHRTGVVSHLQASEGVYADVSGLGTYQEALQVVRDAQNAFQALPSTLRERFGNDPARYVDWATSATAEERDEVYRSLTGNQGEDPKDEIGSPAPESSPDSQSED